ncbi:Galactofuranosyl transferase GlfT1 [Devosia sp. LC5]|uniref:glycosyltransferase n=1 Tax=Devosia sp. LC5 TaxID=1502724 RepID=UPI0004E40737|nr:glycosyltransferase [Devosia sp. LC5]KFC62683.1 Galactofuranosyl transferase GlfT1 [Devosia sp. LC5]
MGGVYAVVLTYNRQSLLRQCLSAITGQTQACDGIIVFDNASNDGTAEMLQAEFPAVEIIQAQRNVGAAGGFNLSMQMAIAAGADRIWVMDDDVIAQPDALEHLQAGLNIVEADGKYPPFVISTAYEPAGELTNVPDIDRRRNSLHYQTWPAYLAYGLAPVTRSTFVSILIPAPTFAAHGYPLASMFIWGEDSEFTLRITKKQPGLMSGASKVTHVRAQAGQLDITTENDERRLRWHQYLVRNTVYSTRLHLSKSFFYRLLAGTIGRALRLALQGHWRQAKIVATGLFQGLVFQPVEEKFSDFLTSNLAYISPSLSSRLLNGSNRDAPEIRSAGEPRAATMVSKNGLANTD